MTHNSCAEITDSLQINENFYYCKKGQYHTVYLSKKSYEIIKPVQGSLHPPALFRCLSSAVVTGEVL